MSRRKILEDLQDLEEDVASSIGTDASPILWIHDFSEETASEFALALQRLEESKQVSKIIIRVDSYGGEIYSLLAMLEAIEQCTKEIYTVCSGKAMSAGAVLLSAGKRRFMGKYSTVMIHQANGGTNGSNAEVQADAKELERLQEVTLGILAKNCGKTKADLKQLIRDKAGADIFFTAKQALEFGLIDKIGIPKLKRMVRWEVEGDEIEGK